MIMVLISQLMMGVFYHGCTKYMCPVMKPIEAPTREQKQRMTKTCHGHQPIWCHLTLQSLSRLGTTVQHLHPNSWSVVLPVATLFGLFASYHCRAACILTSCDHWGKPMKCTCSHHRLHMVLGSWERVGLWHMAWDSANYQSKRTSKMKPNKSRQKSSKPKCVLNFRAVDFSLGLLGTFAGQFLLTDAWTLHKDDKDQS